MLGTAGSWRDQTSDIKPRGRVKMFGSFAHLCFLTELPRTHRVLPGQDLPSTFGGQFQSLRASGFWCFKGSGGFAKWSVCCLGRGRLLHPFCQWGMSPCLQVRPGLARNSRFIAPDLFPSWHSPMPLKFQGCISQWGRNQGNGLCLKGAHGIIRAEW